MDLRYLYFLNNSYTLIDIWQNWSSVSASEQFYLFISSIKVCYGSVALFVQSEVNFLGRLSHPNLVKLLGYCWEDTELLLVYEFMQKGSLENHLFGSKIC